jgi:small conductance mechanosensitive channel
MRFDVAPAWQTIRAMVEAFWALLPRVAAAAAVFALFYFFAKAVLYSSSHLLYRRGRPIYVGRVIGKLLQLGVVIIGLLASLAVIFPSFQARDLIQLLGISGVAIGFAFRDVLQNFLAGVILLLSAPFKIGDEIEFSGQKGEVEDIQIRATLLRAEDGRRVVIPNTNLFTTMLLVREGGRQQRDASPTETSPGSGA